MIGVIGSNGSGKTSLMKAISGLTPLDGGKIFATSRPSFLGVGAAMLKELSGEKNIILGGLAMGFSRAEIKEKLDQIIEFSDRAKEQGVAVTTEVFDAQFHVFQVFAHHFEEAKRARTSLVAFARG